MEEQVCMYSKFGFCKFKSLCKRQHYTEECDNQNCQERNTCQKRHPKPCKRYSSGNCRFKKDCAFKHPRMIVVKDQCELEQKLKFLENIVHELTLKLLDVEEELTIFKNNESSEKPAVEINDHKEDLEEANKSTNKDTEKEVEIQQKIQQKRKMIQFKFSLKLNCLK